MSECAGNGDPRPEFIGGISNLGDLDDVDVDTTAQQVAVEGAVEEFKLLARMMGAYREALIAEGFTTSEAFHLVAQHHELTMNEPEGRNGETD